MVGEHEPGHNTFLITSCNHIILLSPAPLRLYTFGAMGGNATGANARATPRKKLC